MHKLTSKLKLSLSATRAVGNFIVGNFIRLAHCGVDVDRSCCVLYVVPVLLLLSRKLRS